jgi:acyl dehydratase
MFIRLYRLIGSGLLVYSAVVCSADTTAAHIINEDSHPHPVAAGETARFSVEPTRIVARVDVKCSLEGDGGMPLTAVTLRTRGLTEVEWPFPTLTIRVGRKIDFDITALTKAGFDGLPYFEFVNEDRARVLWHQCYNN